MQRLDASDIQNAGSFLERELKQTLPKVYSKKYARYWAEEGQYVPVAFNLESGVTSISEEIVETVGEAAELSDLTDDIPTISSSINEHNFNVHTFVAGYSYTVMQLMAAQRAGRNINAQKIIGVDRALRAKVHQLAVFGDVKRGSKGFFNNPLVPTVSSAYNANTATFQDAIDFVSEQMALIENRNELTESVAYLLVPNNLRFKWASTYQTGETGKTILEGIMANFGTQGGGTLQGIYSVNECRADKLEQFGVKAPGANEDRIIFVPQSSDVVERLATAPATMPAQLLGMSYKVCSYVSTSETIIHYPDAMSYADIAKVN